MDPQLSALQNDYAVLDARMSALESGPRRIWFDDFEADVGWKAVRTASTTIAGKPSRWRDYVATNADHEFVTGEGRNGSAAYRIKLDWPKTQVETGRLTVEFPETTKLHVRCWVRLSEGFVMGTTRLNYGNFWKFWRCHQSPWTRGAYPPYGTNGELNTNFIVGSLNVTHLAHACAWRSPTKSSVDGAHVIYKHREAPHVIPFGTMNPTTREITNTRWVQIDASYILGDTDQDNGYVRQWFDGAPSAPWTVVYPAYGAAPPLIPQRLVTNPRSHNGRPPGFNVFSFIDNNANVTLEWTRQHFIYVDAVELWSGTPRDLPQ
jgi:hypothetical protein